jgi:hypothetical protein
LYDVGTLNASPTEAEEEEMAILREKKRLEEEQVELINST